MFLSHGSLRVIARPSLWLRLAVPVLALFFLTAQAGSAAPPQWVQNFVETDLWSGPDSNAISFGQVPQWSYFLVSAPQNGPRLYVLNPLTGGYAYIDASAVGPSSSPPPQPPAAVDSSPQALSTPAPPLADPPMRKLPQLPKGFAPSWVSNFVDANLWSGPDGGAAALRHAPQFRRFMTMGSSEGNRLKVWDPETDQIGYLDASVVGPSGPSVWMTARPPQVTRQIGLPGRSVGDAYVRNLPITDDETELRYAPGNTPLNVQAAVTASDGSQWYQVGDGQYVRADQVRLPRPVSGMLSGRWIDADLQEPAMVTAYDNGRIVYSALAIKGTTATPTLVGTFHILRRVADEIMDSSTVGIPRDGPGGYYLTGVLYTQYFTEGGASLHYNYWKGTFGYAGSHGCLGLNLADAKWFWDWASMGTTIVVR